SVDAICAGNWRKFLHKARFSASRRALLALWRAILKLGSAILSLGIALPKLGSTIHRLRIALPRRGITILRLGSAFLSLRIVIPRLWIAIPKLRITIQTAKCARAVGVAADSAAVLVCHLPDCALAGVASEHRRNSDQGRHLRNF